MNYPYPEKSFEYAGNRVVYIDHGTGDPIIFLHGQASDLLNFEPVFPLFDRTNRVIALDYPGFGKSDKPEIRFSEEFLVGLIDQLFDTANLQSAALVGHSYGGYLAMIYGVARPERVQSMVLVSTAGIQQYSPILQGIMRKSFTVESITNTTVEKAIRNYRNICVNWTPEVEKYAVRRSGLLKSAGDEYRCYAHAMVQVMELMLNTTIREKIGQQNIRTLLVWGRDDPLIPYKIAEETLEYIPHAKLETIEQCRHFPMLEYPQRFYEIIDTFLRDKT